MVKKLLLYQIDIKGHCVVFRILPHLLKDSLISLLHQKAQPLLLVLAKGNMFLQA